MATHFTIERIREALSKYVQSNSLTICNLIHELIEVGEEDNDSLPTIGITKDGTLYFNRQWVDEHIHSDRDVAAVCLHEIFHPLMSLYYAPLDEIAHIAMDATINAMLNTIYGTSIGAFFEGLYNGEKSMDVNCVLHPGKEAAKTRFDRLHTNLYAYSGGLKIAAPEVLTALRVLLEPEMMPKKLVLVGSHGAGGGIGKKGEGDDKGKKVGQPGDIDKVKQIDKAKATTMNGARQRFIKDLLDSDTGAGFGDILEATLVKILEQTKSPKLKMLEDYTLKHKLGKFLVDDSEKRIRVSVVPIRPSRKDMLMLACGIPLLYYHNDSWAQIKKPGRTLHVYLDTSGSIFNDLPRLLGILKRFKDYISQIYQFSNKIQECSIEDLVDKGRIFSTYGTDFDCIADHALKGGFEKIVIITDGYASMSRKHFNKLKENEVKILTIYGQKGQDCKQLNALGEKLLMDDLLED